MDVLQLHEQVDEKLASQKVDHIKPPLIRAIFAGALDDVDLMSSNVNCQDSEKRTPLHAAAYRGNVDIVQSLLEAGANALAKDSKWITPLHRACSVNAHKVVELLLSYSADVSAVDRFWQTPLHIAAANNAIESLELLLPFVPNLDITDRSGKTALHHAAYNGHCSIVELLISKGCVVNAADKKYFRPLHCAAQMGHVDTIDLLIANDADVNTSDWNQYTPLHVAAANGNNSVCRLLLNAGAKVNAQNTYGNTPLHIACLNGQLVVCQDLVFMGANPEAVNFRGQTPAHLAAASAHGTECLLFLLSQKIDVNKKSLSGRTPLHMTAIHGRFFRSKCLIDQGAIINSTDKNGCTPLHIAAHYGHDLLASTLMCCDAKPTARDHEGRTPLHMCCLSGFVDCCRKFLLAGVDLNVLDDTGKTPLHCAAYKGSVDCVDILVSNRAKFLEKDNFGRIPLHYSASQGHYQCVFTLVGIGSPTNAEDNQGCTPLHLAAGYDRDGKCVEYLIQHASDPLRRDKRGYTPLHYAAAGNNNVAAEILLSLNDYEEFSVSENDNQVTPLHLAAKLGNVIMVQAFLKHGANVNVQDSQGITPLMLAAREGHAECVHSLVEAKSLISICDKINNMTAVHQSAEYGNQKCLLMMLRNEEGRIAIDMADSLKRTPLMLAVSSNHIDCVRTLLDHCADVEKTVNMEDDDRHSSLFRAVAFGQNKTVQLLLTKGAKPNVADVNGKQVIHIAAACGHYGCLQILIDFLQPEDVTVMDGQQCTALHWACYRGNTSCAELLLQTNLFETLNGNKFSPAHCASFSGSVQCLELLINQYGTDIVHLQDTRERYPLHICALHGHTDALKFLLDQGAKVDVLDEDERTPFIAAAQFGQNQIIELLLSHKANKTYQDKYGNTALHWACLMKHSSTALLLLKDLDGLELIHCVNKEIKTSLHIAARNGLVDVTRELLKEGASALAVDSDGHTPALCCAPNQQVAQCLALILLNWKDENEEKRENGTKKPLNYFLRNAIQQSVALKKHSSHTQTTSASRIRNARIKAKFGIRFDRQFLNDISKLSSSTSIKSLFKSNSDRNEDKQQKCFLVESGSDAKEPIEKAKAHSGLSLHRSYSDMSIANKDEHEINLEGTIRLQNLKSLSERKKKCRECILWQKRCSECTLRHLLRKHLQGRISSQQFNEFLLRTLNQNSPHNEYGNNLYRALQTVWKELEHNKYFKFSDLSHRLVNLTDNCDCLSLPKKVELHKMPSQIYGINLNCRKNAEVKVSSLSRMQMITNKFLVRLTKFEFISQSPRDELFEKKIVPAKKDEINENFNEESIIEKSCPQFCNERDSAANNVIIASYFEKDGDSRSDSNQDSHHVSNKAIITISEQDDNFSIKLTTEKEKINKCGNENSEFSDNEYF